MTYEKEITALLVIDPYNDFEIVATEHWCSSGFANTDLDLQLKKHGTY